MEIWLRHTRIPMLATLATGEILWSNVAFEQLVGYTSAELSRKTWIELTAGSDDAKDDAEMAAMLASGDAQRTQYSFRKAYRLKSGEVVQVLIDVLRYPMQGEYVAFLVSVEPIETGTAVAISEIQKLSKSMSEATPFKERLLTWAASNPYKAGTAAVFLAFILFGDRVIEIVKKLAEVWSGITPE